MSAVVALPPRLDLSTVAETAVRIDAHRGAALRLDAGAVTHLGGLGAQLVLAARRDWQAAGAGLEIAPRSAVFDAAIAAFGLAGALDGDAP